MQTITLKMHKVRTRIVIGENVLSKLFSLLRDTATKKAFIIADVHVDSYAQQIRRSLEHAGWNVAISSINATEKSKDLKSVARLYSKLLQARIDRQSLLIALGGGVIGDITGFVAGTYMRGIPWVCIPTTLLAQVDSCIGGKTGVNLEEGKNLVGLFHHPALVVCDIATLTTLPKREVLSGLGEIIKYALLFDTNFFSSLKLSYTKILSLDPKALRTTIVRCLRYKIATVEKDSHDQKNIRALLNFGHTFGHALETATSYRRLRHGEAVLLGIKYALRLSHIKGYLKEPAKDELLTFLDQIQLPQLPKRYISASKIIPLLSFDKKAINKRPSFILLKGIGKPTIEQNVSRSELERVLC